MSIAGLWTWHWGNKNTTFDNPRSCHDMCLNTRNETKGKDLANTEVPCKHAAPLARNVLNTFPKNVGKYCWQTQNVLRNVPSSEVKKHSTIPISDVRYACFLACTLNAHRHTHHTTHTPIAMQWVREQHRPISINDPNYHKATTRTKIDGASCWLTQCTRTSPAPFTPQEHTSITWIKKMSANM